MLTTEYVYQIAHELDDKSFHSIHREAKKRLDLEHLTKVHREIILSALRKMKLREAEVEREKQDTDNKQNGILIYTAFSSDYTIGRKCECVNKAYSDKHGYRFISRIKEYDIMLKEIEPKLHCTWYKIKMALELLNDPKVIEGVKYIMWMDADAIFIDHVFKLEDLIILSGNRELIIGEDMNPTTFINAGVFMLRVCEWSKNFLKDVWNNNRYDEVYYFEQSAIVKTLKIYHEGLEDFKPFHSYLRLNKPKDEGECRLFPHVCVWNHLNFNTNKGWQKDVHGQWENESALFIFHAAGKCNNKAAALNSICERFNLTTLLTPEAKKTTKFFLKRSKMGLAPTFVEKKDIYSMNYYFLSAVLLLPFFSYLIFFLKR